jgi:hypothetical protein
VVLQNTMLVIALFPLDVNTAVDETLEICA